MNKKSESLLDMQKFENPLQDVKGVKKLEKKEVKEKRVKQQLFPKENANSNGKKIYAMHYSVILFALISTFLHHSGWVIVGLIPYFLFLEFIKRNSVSLKSFKCEIIVWNLATLLSTLCSSILPNLRKSSSVFWTIGLIFLYIGSIIPINMSVVGYLFMIVGIILSVADKNVNKIIHSSKKLAIVNFIIGSLLLIILGGAAYPILISSILFEWIYQLWHDYKFIYPN